MPKNILIGVKNPFIRQLEASREEDKIRSEFKFAYFKLEQVKKDKEKLDCDIAKCNAEQIQFKKYIYDASSKIEDRINTIEECQNNIKIEKLKQEEYIKKTEAIDAKIEELKEIVRLAEMRIESYQPYEDLIAKVIEKNPRYKNVFDIIQHVEEMANIRKLGGRLKISDSDDDDETHRSIEIHNRDNQKDKNKLVTDFNDARTHLPDLKESDLVYILMKANIISEWDATAKFNRVNPIHLQSNLERMQDKRKQLEIEIPKQQIESIQDETHLVFSSILHQYRELYLKNHGNVPAELPSIEDQLTYIYKYLKRSIKQLEIHKTYNAEKMTIKEYVIKATDK